LDSEYKDERLALRSATIIMVLVTAVTIIARILFMGPFTDLFDLFIAYLPTAVLLGSIFRRDRKAARHSLIPYE
jgi:hypothetical protein